jgi:magnesium transporter
MQNLRGYVIRADKSCSRVDSLAALEAVGAADTKMLWLDLQGEPDPAAEAEYSRAMGWHPIVIENFRLSSSRPKLINFDRYSQITLHALKLAGPHEEGRTVEIDAVIGRNYLVTYHRFPVQSIEDTLEDFKSARLHAVGPDEVLYHIASHLIDKYVPAVEEKKDLIATLEEEALFAPGKDLLERIVYIRDELIDLGLALSPQQLILAQLGSGVCRHIRPFIRPYFRDAENRLKNLVDEQNSYKEVVTNSLELYRSAMSSRTNDAMKVLTALSALFLPLTFLTGLFGMNVHLPFNVESHVAFFWIFLACAGSFLSMLAFFRARNWF